MDKKYHYSLIRVLSGSNTLIFTILATMKLIFTLSFLIATIAFSFSQKKQAYIIYDSKGKKTSYEKMIKKVADKEVVFIGELHNDPIAHWMEYEITHDLGNKKSLVLGAEMFEADNQAQLNQYITGEINAKQLDSTARLWKNYFTDYAPLVDLAKKNKWPFIATNIPRRYASQVARQGLESLDTLAGSVKAWLAPLPIEYDAALPGYKNMLTMMAGHGGPNLPKAQAIKDATMAHFIYTHMKAGTQFIHYNGSYHSENHEGIIWYLKRKKPNLRYTTITTLHQKDIHTLSKENTNKAHFIICIDENMTPTY